MTIPTEIVGKKIADALRTIEALPESPGQKTVQSALIVARERIKHLELRLGETETMRDRVALQMLPLVTQEYKDTNHRLDHLEMMQLSYRRADMFLGARHGNV